MDDSQPTNPSDADKTVILRIDPSMYRTGAASSPGEEPTPQSEGGDKGKKKEKGKKRREKTTEAMRQTLFQLPQTGRRSGPLIDPRILVLIGLAVLLIVVLLLMPTSEAEPRVEDAAPTAPASIPFLVAATAAAATRQTAAAPARPTEGPLQPTAQPIAQSALATATPLPPAPALPGAPLATVTAPPTPEASQPRVLLDERFLNAARAWPNDSGSVAWIADGRYNVRANRPDQFVSIGAPLDDRLQDVGLRANFRKTAGAPGGRYGFIVRDAGPFPRDGLRQDGRYYVLAVSDRGEVGAWRRETNQWVDIQPWTPSAAVRAALGPNELVLRVNGADFALTVNGVQALRVSDSTLAEGRVGLYVAGDDMQVIVERFLVGLPD